MKKKYQVLMNDGDLLLDPQLIEAENVKADVGFVRFYNLDPIALGGTTVALFRASLVSRVLELEPERVA